MNDPLGASTIYLENQNMYEGLYVDYLSTPPIALTFPDPFYYLNPTDSMVEADDVVNDVMDQFIRSIFIEDEDITSSTVSRTFHPLLLVRPMEMPDVILKSSDGVLFFVHSERLLSASFNAFAGHLNLLSTDVGCIDIPETSEILNIILHIVYDISCVGLSPRLTALLTAVDTIVKYGLPTHIFIGQNKSIFSVLYAHTPLHPIDIYALAAHHGIEPLAKLASRHLLSFVMHTLSSSLVERMGSRYMKRLYFLQLNRLAQLRGIVFIPPDHRCCECRSDTMRSAWAWSAVSLVNDAKPGPSSLYPDIIYTRNVMELGFIDLSPQLLVSLMRVGAGDVTCHCCKCAYMQRADTVGALWALVPATI